MSNSNEPYEASPEGDSPATTVRCRSATNAAARGNGDSPQADPTTRMTFINIKSQIEGYGSD